MKTGAFVIDPAQSDWTTIGWAELSTGFLGELIAQISVQAPNGETYSEYWLRADPVDHRVEYLYYSEIDGGVVRDESWPIDDIAEGAWRPVDDESMLAAFAETAHLAEGPAITQLEVGMEVDSLGAVDDEMVAELGPLWAPKTSAKSTNGEELR